VDEEQSYLCTASIRWTIVAITTFASSGTANSREVRPEMHGSSGQPGASVAYRLSFTDKGRHVLELAGLWRHLGEGM
jgi:hypothetical protein